MTYKLGSLFDGSGGFPLAGSLCGIEPVWAAEVEPYPIAVTRSRFPNMKHLGDISKINGAKVEPVDIITFGSPCQDLSVAGKRAGLKHEANGDEETTRSGLFMEAVRIIREMREATNGAYPRFALWENVPGAFSSNKGEDFRIVLEELIKIVEPGATMPPVPKNGWPYADSYCGAGWSLAYRVFDAQHWGVPQRRRRIHLVLDLTAECAREVSFEREGVRGYFETGRTPWQAVAGDAENCVGAADREGVSNVIPINDKATRWKGGGSTRNHDGSGNGLGVGRHGDPFPTLTAGDRHAVAYSFDSLASNSMKSSNPHSGCRQVEVAKTLDTTDPNPSKNQGGIAIVEQHLMDAYQHHGWRKSNVCGTLTAGQNDTVRGDTPLVCVPYTLKIRSGCEGGGKGALIQTDMSATLATNNDQYLFQPITLEPGIAQREGGHIYEGVSGTLRANMGDNQMAVAYPNMVLDDQGGQQINVRTDGKCPTLRAETHGNLPCVLQQKAYSIENHPADSRVNIDDSGKVQTLTSRMGTGGGNVPLVMEPKTECLDVGFFNSYQETCPTLLARMYKDPHLVSYPTDAIRYIVRRLTPTECARLQGFPDKWGHPDAKEDFTDEEYRFWLEVRSTHATVIGGKEAKDYSKAQMLIWYNKLHTDSAEYKMWGNGIALPPALYLLQGMADVLNRKKQERTEKIL